MPPETKQEEKKHEVKNSWRMGLRMGRIGIDETEMRMRIGVDKAESSHVLPASLYF